MRKQKCQHWQLKGYRSPGNKRGSCFNTHFFWSKMPHCALESLINYGKEPEFAVLYHPEKNDIKQQGMI